MSNIVQITDLKKYFGKVHAVDGISFNVKKGEIFGFLGPNGAGKSTTIRCLMGFNKPNSGKASIFGHDMSTDSDLAKQYIGYLPGNVKLYDHWTGYDHIKFFENVRGKSENLDDLLDRFGFNPNIKFRHLSSGNKQKLGLILALMNEPKLLVMDEPTVGLDPLLQNEFQKILLEMRNRGTTIIISSHNLPEVERLCDRVAIIKSGKIVAIENINDLSDKKIHKIEVHFSEEVKIADFKVKGVEAIEPISRGLLITVGGDINPILRKLAQHNLTDFEIIHASLEDVFMKFYERTK